MNYETREKVKAKAWEFYVNDNFDREVTKIDNEWKITLRAFMGGYEKALDENTNDKNDTDEYDETLYNEIKKYYGN